MSMTQKRTEELVERRVIETDRDVHVQVGDGAVMTLPRPEWLWQLCHTRPEPDRGTHCDDRLLVVGSLESYLYLVEVCTKEEAWRRIKIMRAAMNALRAQADRERE